MHTIAYFTKKILPWFYLFAPTALLLAHGGVDDEHPDEMAVADPSQRMYVFGGVVVVFVLMIGWFIWSKRKSGKPEQK